MRVFACNLFRHFSSHLATNRMTILFQRLPNCQISLDNLEITNKQAVKSLWESLEKYEKSNFTFSGKNKRVNYQVRC